MQLEKEYEKKIEDLIVFYESKNITGATRQAIIESAINQFHRSFLRDVSDFRKQIKEGDAE